MCFYDSFAGKELSDCETNVLDVLNVLNPLNLSYHLQISPWIIDLVKSTNEHIELFSSTN